MVAPTYLLQLKGPPLPRVGDDGPYGPPTEALACRLASRIKLTSQSHIGAMPRYKGCDSLKENEAKFPHHIDMMAPESGFGSLLNAMHDWHDARSIEAVRGQSRHENARYIIRWCFADLVTAALFQKEFGDK